MSACLPSELREWGRDFNPVCNDVTEGMVERLIVDEQKINQKIQGHVYTSIVIGTRSTCMFPILIFIVKNNHK